MLRSGSKFTEVHAQRCSYLGRAAESVGNHEMDIAMFIASRSPVMFFVGKMTTVMIV